MAHLPALGSPLQRHPPPGIAGNMRQPAQRRRPRPCGLLNLAEPKVCSMGTQTKAEKCEEALSSKFEAYFGFEPSAML